MAWLENCLHEPSPSSHACCIPRLVPIRRQNPETGPNVRRHFRDHQTIPVWVDFSFPVVVVVGVGASPPMLTIGGLSSTVLAEYVEGSGTARLLFEYTVSADPTSKPCSWARKRGVVSKSRNICVVSKSRNISVQGSRWPVAPPAFAGGEALSAS